MTRLMAIPIRDKGDAVLIVTSCAGVVLMGFVAEHTLYPFFESPPTMSECLAFVEQNLRTFERILLRKSVAEEYGADALTCVEIEQSDLTGAAVAKLLWN